MKIKLGASEILLVCSALMYSQSKAFSITMFVMGLLGAIVVYLIQWNEDKEAKEKQLETEKKALEAVNNLTKLYEDQINLSLMTNHQDHGTYQ